MYLCYGILSGVDCDLVQFYTFIVTNNYSVITE